MAPLAGFAAVCEAIAATKKKNEKVRLLAAYFSELAAEDAGRAAVFISGRPFPVAQERRLEVGGAQLWAALAELSGAGQEQLAETYRKHGDMGAMAEELFGARPGGGLTLEDLEQAFARLSAARGPSQKLPLLARLVGNCSAREAKYVVKIISADMRIGFKESLVEEAMAERFGAPLETVQRANMLLGDIGETLRLAAGGRLPEARLRLFHPIGFMLASPVQDAEEAFEYLEGAALVEDKYDGIRAHVHRDCERVKIFSRTLDEITHQFPELVPAVEEVPGSFLMDGEILGWREGRPLPFAELQKRLGRKRPDAATLAAVPVVLVAFDLLYLDGQDLFEKPLVERRSLLEDLLAKRSGAALGRVFESLLRRVADAGELRREFQEALARGNEGLMIKRESSPYTPGRRGKAWLKLKQEMATLDVVVTSVEYGHGKRRGLLSDYTFAVRRGQELLDIGKAYSGLTDREIRELTQFFMEHTVEDRGFRRRVEPRVVLEVAFNNIQKSPRHSSGFALRFPRIKRIRQDKSVEDVDTLETVEQLYLRQGASSVTG